MKLLNFYWPHNRMFKKDGDEFERQEQNYSRSFGDSNLHQVHSLAIPKTKFWQRRQNVLAFIDTSPKQYFDRISFFCHGWPKKIDAGFDLKTVDFLGARLKRVAAADCRINLFCCKTGKLHSDGFAARLSDASGLPVLAHSTSGHTTRNPNKFLFYKGEVEDLRQPNRGLSLSDIEYYQRLEFYFNLRIAQWTMP